MYIQTMKITLVHYTSIALKAQERQELQAMYHWIFLRALCRKYMLEEIFQMQSICQQVGTLVQLPLMEAIVDILIKSTRC